MLLCVIIIIIIINSLQFSQFSKQYGPTDQALLIHCPAKTFWLYVTYWVWVFSVLEHLEQGEDLAVLNPRVLCLG